ncbi:hypothetical protein HWQ67_19625 [Candidatus Magnetobacterium casensis]|uniref:Uncharacterized protein n=2 Tax=Candidatus Magnetobacterium casense TaxID=1455061 RepID=A0ABS6S4K0_9BACT|nr:hypothetical protein [Candidatus Magnetobacterium casensis]
MVWVIGPDQLQDIQEDLTNRAELLQYEAPKTWDNLSFRGIPVKCVQWFNGILFLPRDLFHEQEV